MFSGQIAARLVDAGIPLAFGIYVTLLGYGIVGRKNDGGKPAKPQRSLQYYRFGGPVLILFGLFQLVRGLL